MFFGDFNEILHASEKDGGVVRRESHIDAFREVVDVCGLQDLVYMGGIFTWKRGKDGDTMIRERLDRFLSSADLGLILLGFAISPFINPITPPFYLGLIRYSRWDRRRRRFHVESLWLSNPDCQQVVKQAWGDGSDHDISSKVQRCANALGGWAAATFGDVKKRIKAKGRELEVWQNKSPDGVMVNKCKELVTELDDLNRLHESYWFARARANEMRDGDKNTSYFHHKASHRKQRNSIHKLQDSADSWKTTEEEVGEVINSYFTNIFSSSLPSDFEAAVAGLSTKVTTEANARLVLEPTGEEIRAALF